VRTGQAIEVGMKGVAQHPVSILTILAANLILSLSA